MLHAAMPQLRNALPGMEGRDTRNPGRTIPPLPPWEFVFQEMRNHDLVILEKRDASLCRHVRLYRFGS